MAKKNMKGFFENSKRKTLRVQPIAGKFVSATMGSKTINVWLVDPETNEQGTEIPYNDAIELLTLRHPLVCLVQVKDKDGKYVKQLTDEELDEIQEIAQAHAMGVASAPAVPVEVGADVSTLQALVSTQAALIKSQASQFDDMKSEMEKMRNQMAEMMKSIK